MLKDFKQSDILSEAFSFTVFRTTAYTSECFSVVLVAACKFWTHICHTKHLVLLSEGDLMRTFPEIDGFENNFDMEAILGEIIYV